MANTALTRRSARRQSRAKKARRAMLRRVAPEHVIRANVSHFEEANRWMVERNLPELPLDLYSDTTFVIPGKAMAGLYLTNSRFAFLEAICGNPALSKEERGAALDAVLARAVEEAGKAGARLLTVGGPSRLEERLLRHGFDVYARDLCFFALGFNDNPEE